MAEGASGKLKIDPRVRDSILSDPEIILSDRDMMRALSAANAQGMGDNVVDIRGIAIERLESRLKRLEDTHRSVIAAAYENLAGTNVIHRAILKLLDPARFEEFLGSLSTDVADALRVDAVRLVLETLQGPEDAGLSELSPALLTRAPGFVDAYMHQRGQPRRVILRQLRPESDDIYGEKSDWIRSEACMRLDFGNGRLPGLLLLGSEDPHQFKPGQGTDLLTFFADVFERCMKRWLS